MDAQLAADSAKLLAKIALYLSRVTSEVIITARSQSVSLTAFNQSRSLFSAVTLKRDFFSAFSLLPSICSQLNGSVGSSSAFVCKLSTHVLAQTFKQALQLKQTAKGSCIKSCRMTVAVSQQTGQARLIVTFLNADNSIITSHHLVFEPVDDSYSLPHQEFESRWAVSPRLVTVWLTQFPQDDEICVETAIEKVQDEQIENSVIVDEYAFETFEFGCIKFKSFTDSCDGRRSLTTELQLDTTDFNQFDAATNSSMTMSLNDLKQVLALAENLDVEIECRYSSGGRPCEFRCSGPGVEIMTVMATCTQTGPLTKSGITKPVPKASRVETKEAEKNDEEENDDEVIPATPPKQFRSMLAS